MKLIHIAFVLCGCLHSNLVFGVQRREQTMKWRQIAATTVPPMVTKFAKQARWGQQAQAKLNERNFTLPLLVNRTQTVNEFEKEDDAKEYDHKHRVLLAVQSDVKVRDRAKKQERLNNLSVRNDAPETRKRFKDGLKDFISKLHSARQNTDLNFEESELANEKTPKNLKTNKLLTNIPKNRQRSSQLKMLECEDIPHSEAFLNSALKNNVEDVKSKTNKLTNAESISTDSIEDFIEMRKKQLNSRRNQMKMKAPFRRLVWPQHPMPYDRFNLRNPYNYFDCNYFLNPINDIGVPTIEYIWEDYDDVDDRLIEITKNQLKDKEELKVQ